jgi:SAM-dependent methyltransferase
MGQTSRGDRWFSGAAYEPYVGRWSRLVAPEFLKWLAVPEGARWLDVGCGTGVVTGTILSLAGPAEVKGIDRSDAIIAYAREHVTDPRASFEVGDAQALPVESETYDAVVSGLVLNFVPDKDKAIHEMTRAAKPGGIIALYVWDYADKMEMMRHFWDAATALNPAALELDEARRSPICQPEPLAALFRSADLESVDVRSIDVATQFRDFDDYWTPFLSGQAPAPNYAMSLSETDRAALRDEIRSRLPLKADGSIDLIARVWAARGIKH